MEYFLINLHQNLLPESRFRPKQLPLPRTDLLALLRKGYAFFDHTDTDSPPPPVEAVNDFVDQLLPLVKQILPRLVDVTRTDAFTRHNTETLLLGCLDALSTFVQEDFPPTLQGQEPESPCPKVTSATLQIHEKSQIDSFPRRPRSLQSSASHPAIAAAERAFTEHQKSQASQTVHDVISTTTSQSPFSTTLIDSEDNPSHAS